MASPATSSPHPAVTCAENIALLHLLHEVPALPSRNNKTEPIPRDTHRYNLSFEQERSLTGTLAFLAGLKDGPEHIPAICIEEDDKTAGLNVLIAVNKAKSGDGNAVLGEIRAGFEKIFALMAAASGSELEPSCQISVMLAETFRS